MEDRNHNRGDGAFIETFTGRLFTPGDPNPDDVDIIDIAEALSKQCRFTGHTKRFYSVAEHSATLTHWFVSRQSSMFAKREDFFRAALTVLLHDASEAYLADIARPVKSLLPEYKALEERLHAAIAKRFNTIYPHPQWLREIDSRIIVDEREQIMNQSGNDWKFDYEKLGVSIIGMPPEKARDWFLYTYKLIVSEL